MLRVEHCKCVGLLVGSMGLSQSDSQAVLERLRLLLEAAGKKHYTFVMGRYRTLHILSSISHWPITMLLY